MLQASKTCVLLVTFLDLLTFPAWSEINPGADHEERLPITVSVYDDADVPRAVLGEAEHQAAKIFARAEVEVTWLNCTTSRDKAAEGCNRFEKYEHLAMRIMRHSPHSQNDVFGVAFLSADGTGRYGDIFYDRATALQADWKVGLADILGNVMAHELGHLLLGTNSHSHIGIMKAHWQAEELRLLSRGDLGFTDQQADHMRGKLSRVRPAVVFAAHLGY